MWHPGLASVVFVLSGLAALWPLSAAAYNESSLNLLPSAGVEASRPDECPPCFNCLLPAFECAQFAPCEKFSGKCSCPPGFGKEDCSQPVCGSLADGNRRLPRTSQYCNCTEGWGGVNCNVCQTNHACNAMMPEGKGGVCYKQGLVVRENYQMCNVTNRKILDQLKGDLPQVSFSCNAEKKECNFQFWVDQKESFYCALDTCSWSANNDYHANTTSYQCENIKCQCVPGRMLCGQEGSINIGSFLKESIKGPATFACVSTEGGDVDDGCKFKEPAMDDLIKSVFGDESITLRCDSGECLYETDVPGYQRPVKEINTPLIASAIAGSALFVVVVILLVWFLSRRSYDRYGPIHLGDDSDSESDKLMADHKPATLSFEGVSYRLNGKQILSGIQGIAQPGQLLAVMGASGAGKTTFLDILARKNKRGLVEGSFYINGETVSDADFKSVVGFVDQEDAMLPTLTVHETILESALLRLPRDMSYASKEQRVMEVEKQLGIYAIRDQLIGSEDGYGRGISGGERRRVGIARELVNSPSILFLDEPTSGLDAFNAFNVIESLVNLAKTYNRTIIFTIHQPRSNIVALFDQMILLAKGRTVYSGELGRCQPYFDQIGYSCPPGFNIADYLVDLTVHASTEHTNLLEEGSFGAENERSGLRTMSSSIKAVKSVASASNMSMDNSVSDSPGHTAPRPRNRRRASVKQRQDRQLFTRKKSGVNEIPETPRTDDETQSLLDDNAASTQQWLRLSRQPGQVPSLALDDPHQLPPSASGASNDLDMLVVSYADSDVATALREQIKAEVAGAAAANGAANGPTSAFGTAFTAASSSKGYRRIGWFRQFAILSKRTWRNLYRNPMLMLTHYAMAISLGVLSGFLFYGLTDDIKGFQNRLGLFFFILALFGFSTLTSLNVFATERLLFVRERANGYYSPFPYFAARVVFDIIPLRLLPPILLGCIVYPMVGLVPAWPEFFKFILAIVLFNLAAAAICLFIGIVFKESSVASLVGILVMLFSLLFAGLLLNANAIPKAARWLQYLSISHYGFEALIVNEVRYLTLVDHKYGLDIEVPGASILSSFGFDVLALWRDVVGLAIYSGIFILLGYAALHILLVEKR